MQGNSYDVREEVLESDDRLNHFLDAGVLLQALGVRRSVRSNDKRVLSWAFDVSSPPKSNTIIDN